MLKAQQLYTLLNKCQEGKELHKTKQGENSNTSEWDHYKGWGKHLINNEQERKLFWLHLFRKQHSMNMNTGKPRFWVIKEHILIHKLIHSANVNIYSMPRTPPNTRITAGQTGTLTVHTPRGGKESRVYKKQSSKNIGWCSGFGYD